MDTIAFDDLKVAYAKKLNKDVPTAAKQLRARLRSNFDVLATTAPTSYGAKGKVKERANDKRPWGAIPIAFVDDVLGVKVTTRKAS